MSRLLWSLVVVVGIPIVLREFGPVPPRTGHDKPLPTSGKSGVSDNWVSLTFRPGSSAVYPGCAPRFAELAFRELLVYARRSQRTNYSLIAVSADGDVVVHLWIARYHGLMGWMMLLQGWKVFKRHMFATARWSMVTNFSGARRFHTTAVEMLAKAQVTGEREFLIVPPSMTLAAALPLHQAGARKFADQIGSEPLSVTTPEQFLEIERTVMAVLGRRLRLSVAR